MSRRQELFRLLRNSGSDTYRKWSPIGALVLVLVIIGLMHWWSAPRGGDYWWPDSPRHMLNAVFVKDTLIALPLKSPMAWAEAYYDQYPALTIGFYPPGFATALGIIFVAVGTSHPVAQAFVTISFLLLALTTALVARSRGGTAGSLIAGALLLTAPELLIWSRQIQPEVPAIALAMSGVALAMLGARRSSLMIPLLATATFVAALYFKQTVIVLAPLLVWAMLPEEPGRLRTLVRRYLTTGGIGVLLLVPLVAFQLKFGSENLRSVQGIPDAPHQLWELQNWAWYARHLDDIAGWPLMVATGVGVVVLLFGKDMRDRVLTYLLIGLILLIYILFSFIALKEQRHIQPILIPMALLGGLGIGRLLQATRMFWIGATAVVVWVAIGTLTFSAPRIMGPEAAAAWIAHSGRVPCTTLIHAHQNGNFITNLRLLDPKRQCTVLRSDKILFNVTIRRGMGISEQSLNPQDLRRLFFDLGVSYVVMDPKFWDDLSNSRMLVSTVRSGDFVKRMQFPLRIAGPRLPIEEQSTIEIYENVGPVRDHPLRFRVKPSISW